MMPAVALPVTPPTMELQFRPVMDVSRGATYNLSMTPALYVHRGTLPMATIVYRVSNYETPLGAKEPVDRSSQRYPLWLGWLAMFSFVAIITGLVLVMFDPSPLNGLVFPIGLLGIVVTRLVARDRS